jgi:membrane protein YqaA with SNARE-associated domain
MPMSAPTDEGTMFRNLYNWTLRWSASPQAPVALGVVSFVESSVFPIPADVLFVPMCLAQPHRAYRLALIATVMSVLGGIAGWMLGYYAFDLLAKPILQAYGKLDAFNALRATTGTGTILIMLVTSGLAHLPPMKVVTILSGVIAFSLPLFILAAIVARGFRFFALAWALRRYGDAVTGFIERRLGQVVWAVLAVIAVYLGATWWLA